MQQESNIEFWRGEMSQSIKDLANQLGKHDELHKQMLHKQEKALDKIEQIGEHMSQVDTLKQEIAELKDKDVKSLRTELAELKRVYYISVGVIATIMFVWSFLKDEILNIIFKK